MKINNISQLTFGNKMKKISNTIPKKDISNINISALPKEMPLEKKFYLVTPLYEFEKIKDKIQISIDNMKK